MLQRFARVFTRATLNNQRGIATISKSSKIGIVGCGNVGNAVANNLIKKGFPVVAMYDSNEAQMRSMPKEIKAFNSPREVMESTDVVITGLPKPHNVKESAEGPDGLLKGLSSGKIWIDHSTTDYEQTLDYYKRAKEVGAYVLEAPITGGMGALKEGKMVVYVGGDKSVAEAAKDIFEASYVRTFYVGEIGAAMVIKVASNMVAAVNIVAVGEALLLAKRANIDLRTFWDGMRLGAGNSFVWETGAPALFKGDFDPSFSIDLFNKDFSLGFNMAKKFRVPMDLFQFTNAIMLRTQYQFGDEIGCYAMPHINEVAFNEPLTAKGFEEWYYDNEIIDGSVHVKHHNIK